MVKVAYHGTSTEVASKILGDGMLRPAMPDCPRREGTTKPAVCVSEDPQVAKAFGPAIFEVFLNDKMPIDPIGMGDTKELRIEAAIPVDGISARLMPAVQSAAIKAHTVVFRVEGEDIPLSERKTWIKKNSHATLFWNGR
jgi:hypothetical protein